MEGAKNVNLVQSVQPGYLYSSPVYRQLWGVESYETSCFQILEDNITHH